MALPRPVEFVFAVVRRLHEERAFQTVGGLTYATLLSLVPAFAVALSVATVFPEFDRAIAAAEEYLLEYVLPDAPGVDRIFEQVSHFAQRAGRLTAIGLGVFAVTALLLMLTIDTAMNRIFRVPRGRSLLKNVFMYAALLILGPVLVGASLLLTSYAVVASFGMLSLEGAAREVVGGLPFVLTCAALTVLYGVVPAVPVPLRYALAGGVLAGLALELAKRAFVLFVAGLPEYELIYGAFATVPAFLIWVYASWLVVLAGAACTALLCSRT